MSRARTKLFATATESARILAQPYRCPAICVVKGFARPCVKMEKMWKQAITRPAARREIAGQEVKNEMLTTLLSQPAALLQPAQLFFVHTVRDVVRESHGHVFGLAVGPSLISQAPRLADRTVYPRGEGLRAQKQAGTGNAHLGGVLISLQPSADHFCGPI